MAYVKFNHGKLVCTRGIADDMQEDEKFQQFVHESMTRHLSGDWGNVHPEDKERNDEALTEGYRLLSSYGKDTPTTRRIWIITEADRSVTTVLFPDEY